MRVFVTGATGFIGVSHRQRTDGRRTQGPRHGPFAGSGKTFDATGAEVHRGTLEDLATCAKA